MIEIHNVILFFIFLSCIRAEDCRAFVYNTHQITKAERIASLTNATKSVSTSSLNFGLVFLQALEKVHIQTQHQQIDPVWSCRSQCSTSISKSNFYQNPTQWNVHKHSDTRENNLGINYVLTLKKLHITLEETTIGKEAWYQPMSIDPTSADISGY
jgi:hypothetical protein